MSSSSPSPKKKKQNKAKEASSTGAHTAPAKKGSGIFTRLILYGIIPVVLVGLFFVLDPYVSKGYIFEPTVLHAAASKALKAHGNASFDKVVDSIVATLEKRYPGHINKEQQWIFNFAGGIDASHPPTHFNFTASLCRRDGTNVSFALLIDRICYHLWHTYWH